MWIWVHPAIVNVLLKNILTVLDISPVSVDVNANKQNLENTTQETQSTAKNETRKGLGVGNLKSENATDGASGKDDILNKEGSSSSTEGQNCLRSSETKMKYTTELDKCDNLGTVFTSSEFGVKLLSSELCRFHLTGPLSQVVLAKTLQVANVSTDSLSEIQNGEIGNEKSNEVKLKTQKDKNNGPLTHASVKAESSQGKKWWQTYHREEIALHLHEQQKATWQHATGLVSPAELPPHCILGLTVTDPRLQLPAKKRKTYPHIEGKTSILGSCNKNIWRATETISFELLKEDC